MSLHTNNYTITQLKTGLTVDTEIDLPQDIQDKLICGINVNGIIGTLIENEISQRSKLSLNSGAGPDIKNLGIEIKSRNESSKSGISIGSMATNAIIDTPWEKSNIQSKSQAWWLVSYEIINNERIVITDTRLIDLTIPSIQTKLKKCYEYGRMLITEYKNRNWIGNKYPYKGVNTSYVIPDKNSEIDPFAYFEWKNSRIYTGNYEFRLKDVNFKKTKYALRTIQDSSLMNFDKLTATSQVIKIPDFTEELCVSLDDFLPERNIHVIVNGVAINATTVSYRTIFDLQTVDSIASVLLDLDKVKATGLTKKINGQQIQIEILS